MCMVDHVLGTPLYMISVICDAGIFQRQYVWNYSSAQQMSCKPILSTVQTLSRLVHSKHSSPKVHTIPYYASRVLFESLLHIIFYAYRGEESCIASIHDEYLPDVSKGAC